MTNTISPELVRLVGWTLLHFVWQGAAVAALLSAAFAFTQRTSIRYALAVAALLLMLALPFATLFVLLQPAASDIASGEATAQSVEPVLPTAFAHHRSAALPVPAQAPETMLWLVRVWLFGVVFFSLRSAGGYLLMQRLRKIARVPVSGELLVSCMAVKQRMGIERAVRFCRSAALQVPAVVGGIRPIVLLPVSALTGLSESQIAAIVAHELAHVQRLDYFVNLFQVFAETVLFYHPAVWWLNQRIRSERENCCDDCAIAVCGNRVEYVRALTHLEKRRTTSQFAMAANGSPLHARVKRLLGMAEDREGVRSGASLLGVAGIAGLVLAASSLVNGANVQPQNVPTPPAPPAAVVEPAVVSAPGAPEEPQAELDTPNAKTATPTIHVATPAIHVAVPAVRVNNPAIHIAVPAMRFAMPRMNFNFHIHPQLAMAYGMRSGQAPDTPASPATPGESYIDGMKAAGVGDLDVDELVALKIQGVTPEYVRAMRAAGVKVDVDELVGMKIQGVTPEYVRDMRAAYPGIDADTIIGFKVQGITPEYVAQFTKLGVKADADEIMGLRVQGVTAEYVRDMRATGVNFDTDELIGLKVQGVTPAYVNALKSAGFTKLDADEIVGAKTMGVTPEFIEKARSHGFKDLDLEKLIALKNADVL